MSLTGVLLVASGVWLLGCAAIGFRTWRWQTKTVPLAAAVTREVEVHGIPQMSIPTWGGHALLGYEDDIHIVHPGSRTVIVSIKAVSKLIVHDETSMTYFRIQILDSYGGFVLDDSAFTADDLVLLVNYFVDHDREVMFDA